MYALAIIKYVFLPMTRGDEVIRVVKLLFYRSTGSMFIR